ncbi:unnamed protein product [Mytilus coruscus]|uniref:CCHC-type domain-containing protein n=1 Tax=Mytilus coruscus TaxID=42192 RepID=A0A6J8DZN6_MYTCO|nr:unnamed protein product [Mytilus coruscus]
MGHENNEPVPMEIDHYKPRNVCFQCNKPGYFAKTCRTQPRNNRNVKQIYEVKERSTIICWNCNKPGHIKRIESLQEENIISINNIEKSNEKSSKINLDETNVSNEYRSLIEKKIILANQDIYAEKDTDLGRTETVKMKIDTGNNDPIKLGPYRTPLNQRPIVEKAVKEMLEANIIRRSQSPWSAHIVLIKKKDNSIRFCIDYRKIYQITKINSTPLAHFDYIRALLGNASFFSNYDLKSGYWQLAMDSKDREKTAFTCHKGLFEFNVIMAFGLTNAPAVFAE